jgi:hypothetical protein
MSFNTTNKIGMMGNLPEASVLVVSFSDHFQADYFNLMQTFSPLLASLMHFLSLEYTTSFVWHFTCRVGIEKSKLEGAINFL